MYIFFKYNFPSDTGNFTLKFECAFLQEIILSYSYSKKNPRRNLGLATYSKRNKIQNYFLYPSQKQKNVFGNIMLLVLEIFLDIFRNS